MAQFNPQIQPTNDPNYLGLSRPIYQPEGNKTLGTIFQGIGNIFQGVVQAADTAKKHQIYEQIDRDVNYERDQFTSALEAYKGNLTKPGQPTTPGKTAYAEEEGSSAPPAAMDNLPHQVANIQDALRAGKISPSYYYQQLNSIAKHYRTQYPGYKEYIDQVISQVSGVNPANRYMQSIMQDIAAASKTDDSFKNRILTQITKHIGDADGPAMLVGVQSGAIPLEKAATWVGMKERAKYNLDRATHIDNYDKLSADAIKRQASSRFTDIMNDVAYKHLNKVMINTGLGTPEAVSKFIDRVGRGEVKPTPEQIVAVVNGLKAAREAARKEAVRIGVQDKSEVDGKTFLERLGSRKDLDDIIKQGLSDFDSTIELVAGGDVKSWGIAASNAMTSQLIREEATNKLYQHPVIGKYMRVIGPMSKEAPNFVGDLMRGVIVGPGSTWPKDLKTFIDSQIINMSAQPDAQTGAPPHTMSQAVEDAKKLGIKEPKTYEAFIEAGKAIGNPNYEPKARIGLIHAAFSPGNLHLLDKFNDDVVIDIPGQGKRRIKGKHAVYMELTTPDIAGQVRELSKLDPNLWRMYENWTLTSFSKLFSRDIRDLKDISHFPGTTLIWNPENKITPLEIKTDVRLLPGTTGNFYNYQQDERRMKAAVNRINAGLRPLMNIAKETGGDVEYYLLNELMRNGFNPADTKISNAAEGVRNAITAIQRQKAIDSMKKKELWETPKAEGYE